MPTTPYPYAAGKDAEFDAFRAKNDYSRYNAQADADMRRRKAQEDYTAALASLDQQGTYGRRNLDTSLLSRGIFKSGESNRRRGELESTLLQGRAAADTSNANTLGQVSSDLQRAMTGLDLDWEQALSAALARSKGGAGGAGGAGGGGSMPAAPAPVPFWDRVKQGAGAAVAATPAPKPVAVRPLTPFPTPPRTPTSRYT